MRATVGKERGRNQNLKTNSLKISKNPRKFLKCLKIFLIIVFSISYRNSRGGS